jgi:uncharacterized protein (DUF1684 family)
MIVFVLAVLVTASCGQGNKTDRETDKGAAKQAAAPSAAATTFAYNRDSIMHWRAAKDEYLLKDSTSPLPVFDKERFKGLWYYEPSPAYCVTARFEPLPEDKPVIVETTQKLDYRKMQRVGVLRFLIGKDSCALVGYVDVEAAKVAPPVLAVYFKDATNGQTTYEAGRYLELPYVQGVTYYTLDFNRAFSPYCAYNMLYACPLVPQENWLRVSIEAGEQTYQKP